MSPTDPLAARAAALRGALRYCPVDHELESAAGAAWALLHGAQAPAAPNVEQIIREARAGHGGGARWWCGSCSAFVREAEPCRKCRHAGPHVYGEDAPGTGNAARRARLRAEHRRRGKVRR